MIHALFEIDWRVRQKHEQDCKRVLKEKNAVDSKGNMVRWSGEIHAALKRSGHTTLDILRCECTTK